MHSRSETLMNRYSFGGLSFALSLAAVACLAPRAVSAQQATPLKIATVDARSVLRQTPGYAQAETTWTREFAQMEAEVRRLQGQLDSAVTAYQQASIGLTPAARQARERDLREMGQRFEQRSNELRDRAQAREQELLSPLQNRVSQVIQGMRAEGNYTLIIDISAPGSGVVAADPVIDLTQRVLDRLRSPAPSRD
jgi:outer membrane protein